MRQYLQTNYFFFVRTKRNTEIILYKIFLYRFYMSPFGRKIGANLSFSTESILVFYVYHVNNEKKILRTGVVTELGLFFPSPHLKKC